MKIFIFDIDGTLTKTDQELLHSSGYFTHDFWHLLTNHFAENKKLVEKEITAWKKSVSHLKNQDFIHSSFEMLQKSIDHMPSSVSGIDITKKCKEITLDFIKHNIVIPKAIQFINQQANNGHLCILSTASYQDGANGFVEALYQAQLISQLARNNIIISGTTIDWNKRAVSHANIHNNKVADLNRRVLEKHGINIIESLATPEGTALDIEVYADDPLGNDFGILSLASPERRFVIPTHKNHQYCNELEYVYKDWDKITSAQT